MKPQIPARPQESIQPRLDTAALPAGSGSAEGALDANSKKHLNAISDARAMDGTMPPGTVIGISTAPEKSMRGQDLCHGLNHYGSSC